MKMLLKTWPLVAAVFFSCDPVSDDLEKPVIANYVLGDSIYSVGEVLEISLEVTDNADLTQVRVLIREQFAKGFGAWKVVRIDDISGVSAFRNYDFIIPDSSLAGYYSVSLQVADKAGNFSVDSVQYFTLLQPARSPVFSNFATDPPFDADFFITADSLGSLTFAGSVMDDARLSAVAIKLRNALNQNIRTYDYSLALDSTAFWSFEENADTVRFPDLTSLPAGMLITATDTTGHQSRMNFTFRFNP